MKLPYDALNITHDDRSVDLFDRVHPYHQGPAESRIGGEEGTSNLHGVLILGE